jgi:hypothetical protein
LRLSSSLLARGLLTPLNGQCNSGPDQDQGERRAQAAGRDAGNAAGYKCRDFVHLVPFQKHLPPPWRFIAEVKASIDGRRDPGASGFN